MRQTLFFIPHEVFGFPLFGFGWLLIAWVILGCGWLRWLARREGASAVVGVLPFLVMVGVGFAFVFPWLEAKDAAGHLIGLPVRGYGTFVLVGFVSAVWWSIYRARRWGISAETIYSLAVWMFLAGFLGARLFFVIEYWDEFRRATWPETLTQMVRLTEGGLVVYGALIAVLPALILFCKWHRLSPLLLGDIVAPTMAIGLAFGRLGCLMNGCCYGGVCERGPIGLQFPHFNSVRQHSVSPPYQHQLTTGRLHGFAMVEDPESHAPVVRSVAADSPAQKAGLTAGTALVAINGNPTSGIEEAQQTLLSAGPEIKVDTAQGQHLQWSIGSLPPRSLPVHPAQIYSAVNALLLCLVMITAEPYLRRVGSVLALLLTLYPPLRILEEIIRVDEPGQFGTGLSISQLISVGMLVVAVGLWVYLLRRAPVTVYIPAQADQGLSVA